MKILATLDLSGKYIIHDVPLYCHNHPTEPDGMNAAVKEIEAQLKNVDWAEVDGVQLLSIDTQNVENTSGNITIKVDTLESPVAIGSTPVYLRDNAGTLEYSNNGSNWYAVGSGGGSGDMLKSVYDTGDNGIVDKAESLDDSTNTATAAEVRTHLDDTGIHGATPMELIEANSTVTLTVAQVKAGVVIELYDYSTVIINLPARSGFASDETGEIVIFSRVATPITLHADQTAPDYIIFSDSKKDYNDCEHAGLAYNRISLVSCSEGWFVTDANDETNWAYNTGK